MGNIIVWFREDLRLADNPALYEAVKLGNIIPVFILDDQAAKEWKIGAASKWWLHHSLKALAQNLDNKGINLILRKGDSQKILTELVNESKATAIYWNRRYQPHSIEQDKEIKKFFSESGVEVKSFNGYLLNEPWEIKNKQGNFFKVFTPYWKHCLQLGELDSPLPEPEFKNNDIKNIRCDNLDSFELLPTKPDWAQGLRDKWCPGEEGAKEKLYYFIEHHLYHYSEGRDIPSLEATSYLSPHLHYGEISPRQIWSVINFKRNIENISDNNISRFLSELGWREFSYHLLYHRPDVTSQPFNSQFLEFPWLYDDKALTKWQQGKTGYPIVDAGMRELWHTGYMHNRVRMIVASFLTKHLLLPWQEGAKWFWDTLVDADLANNSLSWQWVAGCGADAAPYFRIFNPILQGQKFDSKGKYIRKWVPELKSVPDNAIHAPWEKNNVPKDYTLPIVEHQAARDRAMLAYKKISGKSLLE